MRGRLGVALLLATAAAASSPSTTLARGPGHYVTPTHRAIRFRVHGSHGYLIGVSEDSRRHFAIRVRRGPATVEYEARAPRLRSKYEVRGKVASLGEFDVHFTPHGRPHHFHRYSFCAGPGPTIQGGTVHGTIRFEGERSYTRVVAHSASAELETMPSQRCHYGEAGHSKHPPRYTGTLEANHETGGPGIHFEALRFAPGSRPLARRVFFGASDYEQLGRIRVIRSVRLATDPSTFRLPGFATAPENAVIEPPAPFTGTATFARTPESTFSWTGDLAVAFPGIEPVALAGPDFRLHYCALRACVDQESKGELERQSAGVGPGRHGRPWLRGEVLSVRGLQTAGMKPGVWRGL